MKKFRDWLSDNLFLDFYLDKRWTLRFKLMNLLSDDMLRILISECDYHLRNMEMYKDESPAIMWDARRMQYWLKRFEEEVIKNAR